MSFAAMAPRGGDCRRGRRVRRSHERPLDTLRHGPAVARVGPARGVQPGDALEPREVQFVTGPPGELLQILELRPSVPFAKREDMVHIAQDRSRARRERVRPRSLEIPRRHDPVADIRHPGLDETPWLESAVAFGDLDGAEFARPIVDILEKVAVNRLQMGEVKLACRHGFEKPLGDELPFRRVQRPATRMPSLLRRTVKSGG